MEPLSSSGIGNSVPDSFAVDPKLPRLRDALDPLLIEPRLRQLLGAEGGLRMRLRKHAPGKRAVVEFAFDDGPSAIGKLYRKDRAIRHARNLNALSRALRNDTRTPRLLACWEDLGMLVLERVPGESLDWALLATQPGLVERLAGALAALHSASVPVGPLASLTTHIRRTCHPGLGSLRADFPHLGAALHDIEREMYARERRLEEPIHACHGDFAPRQILLGKNTVTLVDMDGLCHSDPAVDVANFTIGMRVHLANGDVLAGRFVEAYQRARGIAALPGLAHYEAFTCLRRCMILSRKRPPRWEEQVLLLVDRSRRCLEL